MKRNYKLFLLILIVFLLFGFIFINRNIFPKNNLSQNTSVGHLSLINIPEIEKIYFSAADLSAPPPSDGVLRSPVKEEGGGNGGGRAAIFPHHTLVATALAESWQKLAVATPTPSVIVIIGPAHDNQGKALLQTTRVDYQTDFGLIKTDDDLAEKLLQDKVVAEETNSFINEHSIGTHLPFIAKLFPEVSVVPIIAKSMAGEGEARALVSSLKKNLPADALVIFSIDFSHGLTTTEAFKNDETVQELMISRNYAKIDVLNETFLDSPFTLDTFLLWTKENDWDKELIWHSHSGEMTGAILEPGTSYMIFFAPAREKPLTLSFVGDVMLSRAVGSKLKKISLDDAFSRVKTVLADSDLFFANLESVLSTSTVESTKEIRFKADPARIDVLKYLGLTHVSVTNNHIGDYGRAAWDESRNYLNTGGVIPVGGYGNDGAPVFAEAAGKRVAFLVFDTTIWKMDTATLAEIISSLKNQADIIIVSFHWGNEYQHFSTNQQKELAHAAVDAGADVIVGHHPHVLAGIEKYNDGLILYSLGNFIFDQFGDDENESLLVQIKWSGEEKTINLFPARIDGYFPRPATEDEKVTTLERLASRSDEGLSDEIKNGKVIW